MEQTPSTKSCSMPLALHSEPSRIAKVSTPICLLIHYQVRRNWIDKKLDWRGVIIRINFIEIVYFTKLFWIRVCEDTISRKLWIPDGLVLYESKYHILPNSPIPPKSRVQLLILCEPHLYLPSLMKINAWVISESNSLFWL